MNAQLHRIGHNLFSNEPVTIEITTGSEIDFTKVCRTCLRETGVNDLASEDLFIIRCNGKLARLQEMFEISTDLKIASNEMLPRHICDSCLQSVKNSFSFRCQSQRANQILESVLFSLKNDNLTNSLPEENLLKFEVEEEAQEPVELPTVEINIEKVQISQEELAENKPDSDYGGEEEHLSELEVINFNAFSTAEESPNYIDNILHREEELVMDQLCGLSEQDENSEGANPSRKKNSNFRCDVCDAVFSLQRTLILHCRHEHPDEKAFKCDVCSESFVHIQSMRRHKNTHLAFPKKKGCSLCSRSFLRSDDLTRHMRTHTDERPYKCCACQKAFKQHTELKDHMLSHEDKKMYKCEPCAKEWRSRNGWYLHMKAHQDGRNGQRRQRTKKCA